MTLQEAWLKLIDMENYENLSPSQRYSILSDYGVFKEYPNLRLVVKSALEYGFLEIAIENNQDNINLLRQKLINDGFNLNVIQTFIESINKFIPPSNSTYPNRNSFDSNEIKGGGENNLNNTIEEKDSSLQFMGISLGEKRNIFSAKLIQKGYAKTLAIKDINNYYYDEFRGEYIGYKNVIIKIYFGVISKTVFKIEINIKFPLIGFSSEYENILSLYKQKYGDYKVPFIGKEDAKLIRKSDFIVSNISSISILNTYYSGIKIIYRNINLEEREEELIKNERKKELQQEEEKKKILRNKHLSDI